ncbi:hypothetical protein HMPREF0322_03061 [Desulfitobacterium hafniense DP7]|uniref:Uncharacterized protein n=1 Tax=Desulfitobacterium hafniense DP7 TaxID=537010 RepID=G9XQ15_DESHA|nr:hypothetical protein [Desulfitobacterium hafniense]EHL06253.1 hypothetical protein HMPREF0322_03061 [Desulfitobacterium hafniense DP7]
MRRAYSFFIIILLVMGLTACGNQAAMKENNTNPKEKKISFDPGQSFVMNKCLWYDDANVLLVFGNNEKDEQSKMISYNLYSQTSKVLFEGQYSTNYTDQVLINDQNIGYHNLEKALIYDKNSLEKVDEYKKKIEDQFTCYSPNMEYLAEVRKDGLYITNNVLNDPKAIEKQIAQEKNFYLWQIDALIDSGYVYDEISKMTVEEVDKILTKGLGEDELASYNAAKESEAKAATATPPAGYTKESKRIDIASPNYISLSWSEDNAKLVYITNNYSDICILNRDSMEKQTLTGGKDFQYPDGFVQLMWCGFLPNNNDILVNILGESNDTIAILNSAGAKAPKFISENGRITVMDISDRLIMYALNENNSTEEKLICYDYLIDKQNIVYNTTDSIVSAGFSSDQNSIFLSTLPRKGKNEHQLYTFKIN